MPFTQQETFALTDLFNNMDSWALCRLAASVTNGAINPTSREDAFNCIMLHAESLPQILHFKRITRDILLKYLNYLREPVSGHATKDELLQILYKKWNLPHTSKNAHCAPPLTASHQLVQMAVPSASIPSTHQPGHHFEMMIEASRMANTGANNDPLSRMVRSKEVLKEINSMAFNDYIVSFARTFYDLLNNPSSNQCLHSLNDSHFFGESKLKIMIKGANEDVELEGEGICEVLSVLSDVKKEHQLYFSPNLTEQGVRSKQDNHGVVSCVVCGILHQRTGPVGVFEQCFLLFADPFAKGSYKIQETVLILRSTNAVSSMTELMLTNGRRNDQTMALEAGSTGTLAIKDIQ